MTTDERAARRLEELLAELAEGDRVLAGLDRRRAEVVETMLRIDGAVTVLRELHLERVDVPPVLRSQTAQGRS